MQAADTIKVGGRVFFRHPDHSWICGVVESSEKGFFTCKADDPKRRDIQQGETLKVKSDDVEPQYADSTDDTPNDLLNLTILHEATLLRCLYLRYMNDIIYTNIGAIVVALNPFNFTIPRYQDSEMSKYLAAGRELSKSSFPATLVPHSWAQAHITYYEMIDDGANQCVIVSGESGAGKTEASKIVLKYLGTISSQTGSDEEKKNALSVGHKLVACSPILESFGNAKTVRNDNSSRFGKFMKIKFNAKYQVVGAETTKYLLEKSRIISAAKDERIYHSFYLVARGKYKDAMHLSNEKSYVSINSGGCVHNAEYDTDKDFQGVCDSMAEVGMSESEIKSVWTITAAILSLINIRFLPEDDSCSIDPATTVYLDQAVSLLGIDRKAFIHELLTSTRILPGNQLATKPNTVTQALDVRDAMCKHMYDGVFGWLVDRCNQLCDVQNDGNWIGLLDIFGFEDFKVNSFEQLCINLTNETLQYHYNSYIFTRDMDECRAEGIDVTDIKFPDNTPCLKMLTGQGGVFPLLDECCWLGNGTDLGFLEKVVDNHSENPFFKKNPVSRDTFSVHHYAATVTYLITDWIEKNRDTLKDAIKLIVRASPDPIISVCLPAPIPIAERKGGKEPTVSGFFRNQLNSLMDVLNSTNPHWIRCIKPHPAKKPLMFHGTQTMNQLESSGVLGTVKIRKAGYPVRLAKTAFCTKYRICSRVDPSNQDALIKDVLEKAGIPMPQLGQIGKTKVFLKAEANNALEHFRDTCLMDTGMFLQRIGRGCLGRLELFARYLEKHRAEILLQRLERALQEIGARENEARQAIIDEEAGTMAALWQSEEEKRQFQEAIEAEERARREAEEKERLRIEAEERARREEERRIAALRENAAIRIQRFVRGELVRNRLFRTLFEEQHARYEFECERVTIQERKAARAIDAMRLTDERQWIQWLNSVDHLKNKNRQDQQRSMEKVLQKDRIKFRELNRKEEELRRHLEEEESDRRFTLVAKSKVLAAQITKNERARAEKAIQAQAARDSLANRMLTKRIDPATRKPKKTNDSDARTLETLAQYAIQRARAYDEEADLPPPLPRGPHSRPAGSAPTVDPRRRQIEADASRFNQAKQRWKQQEDWVEKLAFHADMPATAEPFAPSPSALSNANLYSGPYRVTSGAPIRPVMEVTVGGGQPTRMSLPRDYGGSYSQDYSRTERVSNASPVANQANVGSSVYSDPAWLQRANAATSVKANDRGNSSRVDWDAVFSGRAGI